jgi:O-antigen/teichoic acid export membrane protein
MLTERYRKLTEMVSRIASAQVMAQLAGFASSIIILHNLDKNAFAIFVFANSLQSFINTLAEMGSSVMSAKGGKFWQDKERLGELFNTYLYIKNLSAILLGIVIIPVLAYTFFNQGIATLNIILITIILGTELYFYLLNSNFTGVYQLHSQIRKLQYAQIGNSVVRLIVLGVFYLIFFNVETALLASLAGTIFQYFYLHFKSEQHVNLHAARNAEDYKDTLAIIKKVIFPVLFYCFQGQIVIFLATYSGNPQATANIGALSRITVLFVIINAIISNIVLPAYARCQEKHVMKKIFSRTVWGIFGLSLAIFGVMFLIVRFAPELITLVLSNKYANLGEELLLSLIGVLISQISGTIFNLNLTKAWVNDSWLTIPATLLVQIVLILTMKLSIEKNLLLFNIYSVLPGLAVNFYITVKGFRQMKLQEV